MKIVILAAMDKELKLLTSILEHSIEIEFEGLKCHHGNLGLHEVYLAKCGIGKVNSAINTYKIIKAISPDIVLNSGVAGGAGVPVGTLLIPSLICYHDVWCGPGTPYGAADGFPVMMTPSSNILDTANALFGGEAVFGLICSGDKFISSHEEITAIREKFPDVKAVDMESASIAQTCIYQNIPFAIVRVVSDTPGEGENISQYQNFWNEAPQKTFETVKRLIESI